MRPAGVGPRSPPSRDPTSGCRGPRQEARARRRPPPADNGAARARCRVTGTARENGFAFMAYPFDRRSEDRRLRRAAGGRSARRGTRRRPRSPDAPGRPRIRPALVQEDIARDRRRQAFLALPARRPIGGEAPGEGAVETLHPLRDGRVADAHLAKGGVHVRRRRSPRRDARDRDRRPDRASAGRSAERGCSASISKRPSSVSGTPHAAIERGRREAATAAGVDRVGGLALRAASGSHEDHRPHSSFRPPCAAAPAAIAKPR